MRVVKGLVRLLIVVLAFQALLRVLRGTLFGLEANLQVLNGLGSALIDVNEEGERGASMDGAALGVDGGEIDIVAVDLEGFFAL